jgi:hypothetical protein
MTLKAYEESSVDSQDRAVRGRKQYDRDVFMTIKRQLLIYRRLPHATEGIRRSAASKASGVGSDLDGLD